jgi:tagatose 6-phosphate kinase
VIITVTLNAALDITYDVDELVPHRSHRVTAVRHRAGGKGVNVASVLNRMGHPVIATGYAGGRTGADLRADLDARGVVHRLLDGGGNSRRTVTVVSGAHEDATVFNEPGPVVPADAWASLLRALGELVQEQHARVVVISGSLPQGLPADACSQLVAAAHAHGALVVVDAEGAALRDAVTAGPELVKPNRHELMSATGCADIATGVAALRCLGARDVVVSDGAEGILLFPLREAPLRAWLREPLAGNPTGAGDALVAALAAGLRAGEEWPAMATRAVAWSAAAVRQPVAGEIDAEDVKDLETQVQMEETDDTGPA